MTGVTAANTTPPVLPGAPTRRRRRGAHGPGPSPRPSPAQHPPASRPRAGTPPTRPASLPWRAAAPAPSAPGTPGPPAPPLGSPFPPAPLQSSHVPASAVAEVGGRCTHRTITVLSPRPLPDALSSVGFWGGAHTAPLHTSGRGGASTLSGPGGSGRLGALRRLAVTLCPVPQGRVSGEGGPHLLGHRVFCAEQDHAGEVSAVGGLPGPGVSASRGHVSPSLPFLGPPQLRGPRVAWQPAARTGGRSAATFPGRPRLGPGCQPLPPLPRGPCSSQSPSVCLLPQDLMAKVRAMLAASKNMQTSAS